MSHLVIRTKSAASWPSSRAGRVGAAIDVLGRHDFRLHRGVLRSRSIARALTVAVVILGGLAVCLIAALAVPVAGQAFSQTRVRPITDPTQLPRLAFENLKY